MKKPINIVNLCFALAILVGDVFYITKGTLLIKSLVSATFVLQGAVNFGYVLFKERKFNLFTFLMLLGLIFAMLGDILLEIEFIIGAALFAVGHVFFLLSYISLKKYCLKDFLVAMCVFIPVTIVILFVPIFNFDGIVMQIVCIAYAFIISLMTTKAIMNYVADKSVFNLVLMVGSILFMFSDLMLLFNVFADAPRIMGILCLATYYPAETFLAYGVLLGKKEN